MQLAQMGVRGLASRILDFDFQSKRQNESSASNLLFGPFFFIQLQWKRHRQPGACGHYGDDREP
jgi:hypothetical protein